jgi:hypothetical protein
MDRVMKSDLAGVKKEQDIIGIPSRYLIDEKFKHNAIFFACLNKNEENSFQII